MKNILYIILLLNLTQGYSQSIIPFYPTATPSGHNFGSQVDVSNNEILVSSNSSLTPNSEVGKVYVFGLTNNSLQQTNVLYPSDALISDGFGSSISIENDFIAIGSPFHDTNAENSGAAYIYRKVNNEWQFFQKITANDGKASDNFGSYVKVHGSHLFISAIGDEPDDQNSNTNNGSVYVYSFNGNQWILSKKLTVNQSKSFGAKIEIENNKAVISSNGGFNTTTNFALHTYTFNNTDWVFLNSIDLGDLEQNVKDFSLSNNHIYTISNNMSTTEVLPNFLKSMEIGTQPRLSLHWRVIRSLPK